MDFGQIFQSAAKMVLEAYCKNTSARNQINKAVVDKWNKMTDNDSGKSKENNHGNINHCSER